MTVADDKIVEALRASLQEAERLRKENQRLRAAPREPIAIVGMACRYPGGVESPDDLWTLLAEERDAICPFPRDRGWDLDGMCGPDAHPQARSAVSEGGFLGGAAAFDPAPFGISPGEASVMDPQQRLLLETSWEAFERAGIDPRSVAGRRYGVFMGTTGQDYTPHLRNVPEELLGHVASGGSSAVLSGRIALTFGLEGPTATLDTACSGSLVALHLACQSLRGGECSMALAGGVTVMCGPDTFIGSARGIGLPVAARCRSFADGADGIGFAEGAGVLLLERLSAARAHGHPVFAVVRGSAIGQEGATNGASASNGSAQRRLIRRALDASGLAPHEVDAVEGQGTGGLLSDAVEAQALAAVYGEGRPADRPLLLGAVKSNLGHTQGASGIAGVLKMVQAMRHGIVPRTLHTEAPSPHIPWDEGRIRLVTDATPWPGTDRPRRAGVSAFGFGGTDAHVILEQAPDDEPPPPAPEAAGGGVVLWPVSGCDPDALRAQAARLLAHVERRPGLRPADVGLSLATSRAALGHRGVVVGESRQDLLDGLRALADATPAPHVVHGVPGRRHRLVVLLTGHALAPGTGKQLYDAFPAFAGAFDTVCAALDAHLGFPARDAMLTGAAPAPAAGLEAARAFAVQVALFRLAESWGVRPGAVHGHGIGHITEEHIGGRLALPDACAALTGPHDPGQTPRDIADQARAVAKDGTVHLELGGHEVAELLDGAGQHAVAALRPGVAETTAVATALARVYAQGTAVDWDAVFAGTDARRVELPTYAFQRARYWSAAFDTLRSRHPEELPGRR
ncbi:MULTISPECIES: type I polyketide synthase [unclassified Streptomyces]|uniref:type I polyketide synthase n=1 Tax=unclassified Streptomyces TaxID=2593676 RepID=UPI00336A6E40